VSACVDCARDRRDGHSIGDCFDNLRADLFAARSDLAQASVLLRASEARHEREHAADVEALRVLEATCTGLRGALREREWTLGTKSLEAQIDALRAASDLARATAELDEALTEAAAARADTEGAMAACAATEAALVATRAVLAGIVRKLDKSKTALAAADAMADAIDANGGVVLTRAYRAARGSR